MHDILLRTALAPVLVAQGVHTAARAVRLPEPAGPREGRDGAGPRLRVLIAGDSSAAGVGVRHQEQALSGQLVQRLAIHHTVAWRLIATTGDTTRDTLARLEATEADRFDLAVVALGVNDVTKGVPVALWVARQKRLVRLLQQRFGVRRIYASGLPPLGTFPLLPQPLRWVVGAQARRFDNRLARLAAGDAALVHVRPGFGVAPGDFAEDGYHPTARLYARWADVLAEVILADVAAGHLAPRRRA